MCINLVIRVSLMHIAAFENFRMLGETHNHLTATVLKPAFCSKASGRCAAQPENPNDISAKVRRQIPSPIRANFQKYGFPTPNKHAKSTP
ncbi:MAG: hypothetical protein WAS73_12060 [Defluviicoccus sp.]